MSLGGVEQLKERGIELLRNEKGNEIYMSLFEDWKTISQVSIEIYPHLYESKKERQKRMSMPSENKKKVKQRYKKNRPQSAISRYINAFDELGWLEHKPVKKGSKRILYRATLKPYFLYLKKKGKSLSPEEKKRIIRKTDEPRAVIMQHKDTFFDAMDEAVSRVIYLMFNEQLFLFPDVNTKKGSKFAQAFDLALKFFDYATLKILQDYLTNWMIHSKSNIPEKKSKEMTKLIFSIEEKFRKHSLLNTVLQQNDT